MFNCLCLIISIFCVRAVY